MKIFRCNLYLLSLLIISACIHSKNPEEEKKSINTALDNWHKAAATADTVTFFNFMDENAVYIGTDPSENWTKEEFFDYAMPYFRQGKGWEFKCIFREIFLDHDIAWFNENLDTWMGVCHGSGVLRKDGNNWKLCNYQLSMTIPNDKTREVLKIIREK